MALRLETLRGAMFGCCVVVRVELLWRGMCKQQHAKMRSHGRREDSAPSLKAQQRVTVRMRVTQLQLELQA
jgi:hypothetical protein